MEKHNTAAKRLYIRGTKAIFTHALMVNYTPNPSYLSISCVLSICLLCRFMPRVDIVEKHNTAARRLYIRGHNGKIYPYLVMNDSGLSDSRRDERVLQLLRMLNHYLAKQVILVEP